MSVHLDQLGLSDEPFSKEIDDEHLWIPPSKQEIVDDIVETIESRQSAGVIGEPGVGKTCVLRAVRRTLPPERFRLTYYHNATLGRRDFYRHLCLALGLGPTTTSSALFWAVSCHVEDLAKERVHPVFLLDEAHLLHQDTLDHLHILLNYQWDSKALLSLILVGLPDLDVRLRLRRNRSLHSRLSRCFTIDPIGPDDTADYIRTRLRRVGCDRDLFPSDSIALLHEAAFGTLRDIDRFASLCLRAAARKKRKVVDRDVVSRVLKQVGEVRT
jgi:general secretion pathway protein A